jgi:UDP-N-acetylglucosamine--N-acetylmuramyl-(pentapeptide) pyrophosphoryl-undecaprenol N-acetylglucosamine transferase
LIWQTGKTGIPNSADSALIERASREHHLDVREFIDDMPGAYAMADLAACRAGAMTLAELAVAGVPAILIPFPFATDDHQTVNAQSVVNAGAARLIHDRDLSPELLVQTVSECLDHEASLQSMASSMKTLARPNAALEIADIVLRAARPNNK